MYPARVLSMTSGRAQTAPRMHRNKTKGIIMYGPSPLAVGILAIGILIILWRVVKGSVRMGELVFLGLFGMIFFGPRRQRTHRP